MASMSGNRYGKRKSVKCTDSDFEETIMQWLDETSYAGSESSEESDYGHFQDIDVNVQLSDYNSDSDSEENYSQSDSESMVLSESNNQFLLAPSNKKWSKYPKRNAAKFGTQDIIRFTAGPRRTNEIFTFVDACRKFITSDITDEIILCTNREAARICTLKNKKWHPIQKDEMDVFLGILLMAGVEKSWDLPVRELFLDNMSNPIYSACMSVNRFEDIRRFLRFDDKRTRSQRLEADKLAHVSYIWKLFLIQCKTIMIPKENVTIDEQLVGFRGRCSFIQYMPSKPAKYGLKFFWLCESDTGYAIDGNIYVGKQPGAERQQNLGMNVVQSLVTTIKKSSRNLTVDNFFTSVELFEKLLSVGITAVGTIRKNKRDIPKEMQANKERVVYSSCFGFDDNMTLVSYVPKKNKAVLLLSTLHFQEEVDNSDKKNPEIIHFYNKTKGGVDVMDQKVMNYTCKRQTKRWPMVVWSNIMDVGALNAFILFVNENPEYENGRNDSRRLYLKELAKQLILPYMERRSKNKNLQKPIIEKIEKFITIKEVEAPRNIKISKKKRCYMCHTKKDRKCDRQCALCQKPICKDHTMYACINCK